MYSFFQLLIVSGSFGLREFTQIRYDAQRLKKKVCREETLILNTFSEPADWLQNSHSSSITRNQWREPPGKHNQCATTPPSGRTLNCTWESFNRTALKMWRCVHLCGWNLSIQDIWLRPIYAVKKHVEVMSFHHSRQGFLTLQYMSQKWDQALLIN